MFSLIIRIAMFTFVFVLSPDTQAQPDTSRLGSLGAAGQAASAGTSAGDISAGNVDCACRARPGGAPCPKGAAGRCGLQGLNAGALSQALAMMMSSMGTKGAVDGSAGDFDFKPIDWNSPDWNGADYFPDCPNASNPLCAPGGLNNLINDLGNLKDDPAFLNAARDSGYDPTQSIKEIDKARSDLQKIMDGDYKSVLGAGDGSASALAGDLASDTSAGGAGGGSKNAGRHAFSDPSLQESEFGNGSSANYRGIAGLTATQGAGGNSKVGPVGARLGNIQWNGSLDAVDAVSGRSLTLWQRATRRYMGTPEGKRGFSMARIEFLRKQSPASTRSRDLATLQREEAKPSKNTTREQTPSRDEGIMQVQMSSGVLGH